MKKYLFIALAAFSFITLSQSCKKKMKDADIEKAANEQLAKMGDMMKGGAVTVKDGVATITGECKDDACKAKCAEELGKVKGVKSVVSNCTIAPPPMPVVTAADEALNKGLSDALKDFGTVKAAVKDGVVTLTGEIKKDAWMKLKPMIDKLKPKSTDSKGLTIK